MHRPDSPGFLTSEHMFGTLCLFNFPEWEKPGQHREGRR